MNAKNGIKIVKREERSGKSAEAVVKTGGAPSGTTQPGTTQRAARQVAAWVKEFQQRRVEKGFQSFDSLFQRA